MRDAVLASGETGWRGHGSDIALTDVHAYVDAISAWANGKQLPQNWVPNSTYWIVDDCAVVGELNVRHRLTPWLRTLGGHIGYHTHPEHRGKGVATFALHQALNILRAMRIDAALITCSESNAASAAVIEKCGGMRAQDAIVAGFEPRRRYVVPLAKPGWFGDFEDLRRQ